MKLKDYYLSNIEQTLNFLEHSRDVDADPNLAPNPDMPYHKQSLWIENEDDVYEYQVSMYEDYHPSMLPSLDNCGTACCVAGFAAVITLSPEDLKPLVVDDYDLETTTGTFQETANKAYGLEDHPHGDKLYYYNNDREALIQAFQTALDTKSWDHLTRKTDLTVTP